MLDAVDHIDPSVAYSRGLNGGFFTQRLDLLVVAKLDSPSSEQRRSGQIGFPLWSTIGFLPVFSLL